MPHAMVARREAALPMDAATYQGNELELLAEMPNYYDWVMEGFVPHVRGHVVEYGAGVGAISKRLLPHADRLILVEPAATLVTALQGRFALASNVSVVQASLEAHAVG